MERTIGRARYIIDVQKYGIVEADRKAQEEDGRASSPLPQVNGERAVDRFVLSHLIIRRR